MFDWVIYILGWIFFVCLVMSSALCLLGYIVSRRIPLAEEGEPERPSFDELIEAVQFDPLMWVSTDRNPFRTRTTLSNSAIIVNCEIKDVSWAQTDAQVHISLLSNWEQSLTLSLTNGKLNWYRFPGHDTITQLTDEEKGKLVTILELVQDAYPKQ